MTVRVIFHPRYYSEDVPELARWCKTLKRYIEVLQQIDEAVEEIKAGHGVPERSMEPPLGGWKRKKLHSDHHPTNHQTPDLRMIYQFTTDGTTLKILGVGRRIPSDPGDIYAWIQRRDHDF